MLLQLFKFSLIAENAPLSCAKRCRKEGEGGSRELSVSGCCLCALSGWRGMAWCSGQEPRQPSSKVNSPASLSSPGLCLFCPLQAPPERCWQPAAWRCAHVLQTAWQLLLCVCLCCCPATAATSSAGLVRVLAASKNPTDGRAAFPGMLLQGAVEQKAGRLLPEILISSSRLPGVSQKYDVYSVLGKLNKNFSSCVIQWWRGVICYHGEETSADLQLDSAVCWFEGDTWLVKPVSCSFGVSGSPSCWCWILLIAALELCGKELFGGKLTHSLLKVVQVLVNVAEPTQKAGEILGCAGLCSHSIQGCGEALRGVHLLYEYNYLWVSIKLGT